MKHFHIDEHTKSCKEAPTNTGNEFLDYLNVGKHDRCVNSPIEFIFYSQNEFYLVTYYGCVKGYDTEPELREKMLRTFFSKRGKNYWDTRRAVHVNENLKEARLRGINLNTNIDEINYIYYDNAWKEYAITTTVDSLEIDLEKMSESFKKAKEYLVSTGRSNRVNYLESLFKSNYYDSMIDQVEVYKNVDHAIKQINKQIKQSYEK